MGGFGGGCAVLVSGAAVLAYTAFEVWCIGKLDDAALVTINKLIIYRFGIFIVPRFGELFEGFPQARLDPQAKVEHLLGHPAISIKRRDRDS